MYVYSLVFVHIIALSMERTWLTFTAGYILYNCVYDEKNPWILNLLNNIKRFRETGEISVRKVQGRRTFLDACGLRALKRHCIITHQNDSSLTLLNGPRNTSRTIVGKHNLPCYRRCQLKLCHAKRKPYVNMVQKRRCVLWTKARLNGLFQSGKVFYGQTSKNVTFLLEITDAVSSGLKRRETFQRSVSKTSIFDGMEVHKCIWYGQLACLGRHYECWKVYKGFRATYAPPDDVYFSEGLVYFSGTMQNNILQLLEQHGFILEESGCWIGLPAVHVFHLERWHLVHH